MKKSVVSLIAAFCMVLGAAILSACSLAGCTHEWFAGKCTRCGQICSHTWENGSCIVCKTVMQFQAEPLSEDSLYVQECALNGTLEEVTYTTHAYMLEESFGETDLMVDKFMYVYLPHGYDPEKQYNVLYLLHGSGETAGYWFGQDEYQGAVFPYINGAKKGNITVQVLDNMIAQGLCEPLIVVTPSYYSYVEGYEIPDDKTADRMLWIDHFYMELENDIIPLIESRYSTYAQKNADGSVSRESLVASRDHRGIAGLSMGSQAAFMTSLVYLPDFFGNIGLFSGPITADAGEAISVLNSETFSELEFQFLFSGQGQMDFVHEQALTITDELVGVLNDRFIDGTNYAMVDTTWGEHTYKLWITCLINCLLVFY